MISLSVYVDEFLIWHSYHEGSLKETIEQDMDSYEANHDMTCRCKEAKLGVKVPNHFSIKPESKVLIKWEPIPNSIR